MEADRAALYRHLIEAAHWTPQQCADVPITVMAALWGEGSPTPKEATPDDLVEAMNARRAKQGKAPLTPDQAWENEAAFRQGRPLPWP